MFSLDLNHLNILVMLILAFFSYRNYRGDALALEYDYQSQEEMNAAQNQGADENVEKKEINVEAGSEMVPQSVQVVEVSAECTLNSTPVENETPSDPTTAHEQTSINSPIQAQTLYPSIETIQSVSQKIVQSTISSSSLPLQKESDQESTLLNRNIQSLIQNECPCDEEQEEGIFSSDNSSMNSSSCSSSPSEEDLNAIDKKDKRKLIQKAKRKLKKQLKKKQFQQSQPLIHLVQLQ